MHVQALALSKRTSCFPDALAVPSTSDRPNLAWTLLDPTSIRVNLLGNTLQPVHSSQFVRMDQKASPAATTHTESAQGQQPEVVALQPLAVVDHLCNVTEDQLKSVLEQEEIGGSRRISQQQVQDMLAQIGEFHSKAGGSNANTIRGTL